MIYVMHDHANTTAVAGHNPGLKVQATIARSLERLEEFDGSGASPAPFPLEFRSKTLREVRLDACGLARLGPRAIRGASEVSSRLEFLLSNSDFSLQNAKNYFVVLTLSATIS